MPSVASTIFKIRAHTDFVAPTDSDMPILSFRKGQPFYALSSDYESGTYFVSTQFAVPFARQSVSGLVPMEYFERVALLSKDPPIQRKKKLEARAIVPVKANDIPVPPVPVRRQSLLYNRPDNFEAISLIEVVSYLDECFNIKVIRGKTAHIITRSIPEFIALAAAACKVFRKINVEDPLACDSNEAKIKAMEVYLNHLCLELLPTMPSLKAQSLYAVRDSFFLPKDLHESFAGQTILRRDSGAGDDGVNKFDLKSDRQVTEVHVSTSKSPNAMKSAKNVLANFSRIMFG
jgi:hypothetical protein